MHVTVPNEITHKC